MKKVLFVLIIVLIPVSTLFSQINKEDIAFDLRYPIPVGNNILNNNATGGYTGLVDIGVDYTVMKFNNFGLGVLINSSVLSFSRNDVTLMILSPKIKLDYKINIDEISIIPNIAVGYSNWHFSAPVNTLTGEKVNENYNGITCKGAMKIVLNSNRRLNWYFQLAYEFTKLEKPDNGATDSNYNRDMHILYPGIGVIWKFNKE